MNSVQLVGRLVKDPEVYFGGKKKDKQVTRFRIAVNRSKDEADYINCVTFDVIAEVAEKYLKKGHRVGLTGRLHTDSYENDQKVTIYTTDVYVNTLDLIETKAEAEEAEDEDDEEDERDSKKANSRRR